MQEPLASVWPLRVLANELDRQGLATDSILAQAGINRAQLDDVRNRVPHVSAIAAWQRAAAEHPSIGLDAAASLPPGAFGVLEYAARSAETLGDALRALVRNHRLLHEASLVQLDVDDTHAELRHVLPSAVAPLPQALAEFILATWMLGIRQLVPGTFAKTVWTPNAPSNADTCRELFGVAPSQQTGRVSLVLDAAALNAAPTTRDATLHRVLDDEARATASELQRATSIRERVTRILGATLSRRTPDVEAIAAELRMSTRTLNRRLRDEGTTYRDLLDDVRKERALSAIATQSGPELAAALGFSEASAFNRAFKRWTGQTPGDYARQQKHTR